MGKYIDRDELLELYANTDGIDISDYDVRVAGVRQNILDMPTIDIIRCKECKHYNGHEQYCEIDHFARENDFCSSGKRETITAECSECGYIVSSYYWATTYYHYCPNCGARMERRE